MTPRVCFVCEASVPYAEARAIADRINEDPDLADLTTNAYSLVALSGPDEMFLDEDDAVVLCQGCVDKA